MAQFSLYFIIITFFLVFIIIHIFKSKPETKTNLPPGSFGWPIIGETYAFVHQKHDKFISERMKKYSSKIYKTHVFGEPVVVLCGTSGHKFISSNEGKLLVAWRPWPMQKLFRSSLEKSPNSSSSPPPLDRQTKTQITRAPGFLKPEALVRYVGEMDSIVKQHMEIYWEGKEKIEAHRLTQTLLLTLAGKFFLGIDQLDRDRIEKVRKFMAPMMLALHLLPLDFPGTEFYRGMRAADGLREELELLIREKKKVLSSGFI